MDPKGKHTMKTRLIASISLLAALLCAASLPPVVSPALAQRDAEKQTPDRPMDELILQGGKVVKGWIQEETESQIVFKLSVHGMTAERTYDKSEIIRIIRAEGAKEQANGAGEADADDAAASEKDKEAEASEAVKNQAAKLYVTEIEGIFGRDISPTPVEEIFEDVDDHFNDKVEVYKGGTRKQIVREDLRNKHIVVIKLNSSTSTERRQVGAAGIFQAEEIAPVFEEEIMAGRRIVFWIEHAQGGAAFLPFISPEIYFTPDGMLGGFGDLEQVVPGDRWVREKLMGAYLGHMEGFAIFGGHAEQVKLIRAMARKSYWLYYRLEGGRPEYINIAHDPERHGPKSSWTLLSDNGKDENQDKLFQERNDVVNLNAELAKKLGVSRGTASTIEDLAVMLNVGHNYEVLEDTEGEEIIADWKQGLRDTVEKVRPQEPFGDLWRDYYEIQVQGDYRDRKRARSKKINILMRIRSTVRPYKEVLDPDNQLEVLVEDEIDRLKLSQQLDNRRRRRR